MLRIYNFEDLLNNIDVAKKYTKMPLIDNTIIQNLSIFSTVTSGSVYPGCKQLLVSFQRL